MTKNKSLISRISEWLVGTAPQQTEVPAPTPHVAEDTPLIEEVPTTPHPDTPPTASLVRADHIVDLRSAITHAAATFHSAKFYNTQQIQVSHTTLYLLPTAEPYEIEACQMLAHDTTFMEQLRQEYSERLIQLTPQFVFEVELLSSATDLPERAVKAKAIYPWLFIEVTRHNMTATPVTPPRHYLVLTATAGELWSEDGRSITITPDDCPCYIGRCQEVVLKTGARLINKVAFVGVEEQPERAEALDINRYVSRSAVRIDYNAATQQYSIERSPYITSANHVVHLRRGIEAMGKIALSPYVRGLRYTLNEGDTIEFNRKVGLSVHFVETPQ